MVYYGIKIIYRGYSTMLNTEMVNFFESILDARSDEFRVTDQDLVSEQAFE